MNAPRCWSCELALPALDAGAAVPGADPGVPGAATAPAHRSDTSAAGDHAASETPRATPRERTPDPEDPRAAVDRAFAPLREAHAQSARRRRRWLAGGALAATAVLAVAAWSVLQSPVGLQVDAAAPGPAPAPATVGAERAPASARPAAAQSAGDDLATASEVMPDPATALGLARADAASPARRGSAATAATAATAARTTTAATARTAPPGARAPHPRPDCALAAAVLGLCRREAEPR